MLVLVLKSKLEQLSGWIAERVLGPLERSTRLRVDDDMRLLLRVEVPRCMYRPRQ